jgi:Protein of unknown function (DUF3347)
MKKLFFIAVLFATAFVQYSFGQPVPTVQEYSTKTQSALLLTSYLNLKDALVGSNAVAAAASADAFVKALNNSDKEIVHDESRNALLSDATAISQAKNLATQREKFATLSGSMYALAKKVKLTTQPLYQQYCPMKKASWSSTGKAIKNPYYGSAMLTCGSINETL